MDQSTKPTQDPPLPQEYQEPPWSPSDEPVDLLFHDDYPTPPVTPPLPSSLPTSPAPQTSTDVQLTILIKELADLKQTIVGPHVISIVGVTHLRNAFNKSWKDKIFLMFYEALIPYQWIIDIATETETDDPNIVIVHFLNSLIVQKVKQNLDYYLNCEYMGQVSIL